MIDKQKYQSKLESFASTLRDVTKDDFDVFVSNLPPFYFKPKSPKAKRNYSKIYGLFLFSREKK